jgi:H+-transporting ATPase
MNTSEPMPHDAFPASVEDAGLTAAEARNRLASGGPNRQPDDRPKPIRMALGQLWAPVPWMLEAAIVLHLVLGKPLEAAIIAVLLVFNAALGMVLQSRAQATLAALRARLALSASVRRDGRWGILPAAEVVVGDLVKLTLGAVVPADVRITGGEVLIGQAMLTGESVPVEAGAGAQTWSGAARRWPRSPPSARRRSSAVLPRSCATPMS